MKSRDDDWLTNPDVAYARWQEDEAVGSRRRPFSSRSIVQHRAMFGRFLEELSMRGVSLATFGDADLDAFQSRLSAGFKPGTTTWLRYLKLIDRVCRHLVLIGVRGGNPAAARLTRVEWPDTEPTPTFLPPHVDVGLQAWVAERCEDDLLEARNRAVVALFLGCGVTVAELQGATVSSLHAQMLNPYFRVEPVAGVVSSVQGLAGAKCRERTIRIDGFAVEALTAWEACRTREDAATAPLFPGRRTARIPPRTLDRIVSEALATIGFVGADMSPRVLRNTYARRHLLDGRSNADVTAWLGLNSERTVTRLRATINSCASVGYM
ncbi:tyrosine-type recombinase/integrase [Burkholderia sp. MBR-1]|uniref:tyrosine-type recombinase/integrase n=1 Tax=Burkholderia sp. MBR-1 TaxID=2732364 RepID=UPI0015EE74EE|nr:tyrosine-type recombinase/integrase [Burkholderia sp. MBR-1]QMI49891.1 tyrosine-type recombinase/integrase [Burkholderia sp. MBR-1]